MEHLNLSDIFTVKTFHILESCPEDYCAKYTFDMYDWSSPGLGRPVLFMTLQGLIFFALILFGESGIPQRAWQKFLESANRGNISIGHDNCKLPIIP